MNADLEHMAANAICHAAQMAGEAWSQAGYAAEDAANRAREPFMQLRPKMFIDGDQWCALYGENLQDGVAGFGSTPAKAEADFNRAWLNDAAIRRRQP